MNKDIEQNNIPLLSICIPTYEMHGKGVDFLKFNLDILTKQNFKDFDVVISDNSTDDKIENFCNDYKSFFKINYFKNTDPKKRMGSNINNTLKNANGKLIKILFQDDFLYDENSLEYIINDFDLENDTWLVTSCKHTQDGVNFYNEHIPHYNHKIHTGKNTIGSPSVLTIKNKDIIYFDENLDWVIDCDYYKKLYKKFGSPVISNNVGVIIRTGKHQMTNILKNSNKRKEVDLMKERYKNEKEEVLHLPNVTVVAVSGIDPTGAINALQLSMKGVKYFEAVLISHKKPENLPSNITFKKCLDTELSSTDPKNKDDYSYFMAYRLCNYIDSDYCLIVHNDAYVLRPYAWDKAFLKYDYIGAPWPKRLNFRTDEGILVRVGNGGFSLRSKKCLNILNELHLPFTDGGKGFYNEDGILCVYYRKQLEDAGLKFAPVDIASAFAHELDCEESVQESFGFHNSKVVFPTWMWPIKKILRKLRIVL